MSSYCITHSGKIIIHGKIRRGQSVLAYRRQGGGWKAVYVNPRNGKPRFRRPGPPRGLLGQRGYFYHSPYVAVGKQIENVGSIDIEAYLIVNTRLREYDGDSNSSESTEDVPEDVYPDETFRTVLGTQEVILTCPDICETGERIIANVVTKNP